MVSEHPAHRTGRSGVYARRLLVALLSIVFLVTILLVAAYLTSPPLISAASPAIAERLGLDTLHIAAERPTTRRIVIRELEAANASVTVSARGIVIDYTLSGLWQGAVTEIVADQLSVTVLPAPDGTEAAETAPPGIPELPLDRFVVRDLSLHVPAVGFRGAGSATLSADALDLDLRGLAPEAASRFSLRGGIDSQGMYSAQFFDREQPDDPFVALTGTTSEQAVTIAATLDLRGYAFELVSSLLELPEGRGSLSSRLTTGLPWPLPDTIEWESLSAEVRELALEWQSLSSPFAIEAATNGVTLSGGAVSGSVRGGITHNAAGTAIAVSITEDLPFDYADGTIRTDDGSIDVSVSREEDAVNAVIRSLSANIGDAGDPAETPRVRAIAELDALTAGVRTTGELRIDAQVEPVRERVDGDLSFDGSVDAGIRRPIVLSSDFAYENDALSMNGTVSSGVIRDTEISFSHDLEDGRGTAVFAHTLQLDQPLLGSVLDDWPARYDLTSGTLTTEGEVEWAENEPVAAATRLSLSNGSAFHDETTATGVTTELGLSWDDVSQPLEWRLQPAWIRVSAVNVGFPITNLASQVARTGAPLSVRSATAEVLGGDLTIAEFDYDLDAGSAEIDARLVDVNLAQLLALEGEQITGSGKIDAVIPVRLADNTPRVEGGTFEAQPPGGTIAIASSFAPESGQPGLDFALRALTDFRYTGLSGNVDYSENGDLQLAIRLDGNNPAIEEGRAIRYNLNISENIPVLLESLRLSGRFTERLQEGVNE